MSDVIAAGRYTRALFELAVAGRQGQIERHNCDLDRQKWIETSPEASRLAHPVLRSDHQRQVEGRDLDAQPLQNVAGSCFVNRPTVVIRMDPAPPL